jgi:hypothetical protein
MRAPFSWGRTYGLCSASTVDCQRPTADAVLVSGYTSPGQPLNRRTRSAEDSPKRMPSRGSGSAQPAPRPEPQAPHKTDGDRQTQHNDQRPDAKINEPRRGPDQLLCLNLAALLLGNTLYR